ncbi:DUF3800 domain-containing protein [Streptomyces yanii]|uniref:DUF3800 domain-containing protein n=1 Tax=Streptomyces yanii TaxID=78510 RepID=A0ABV5RNE9_9ACTN
MPLTGDDFTQCSWTTPTKDGPDSGRWVACDESGYGGEQLLNNGRYLVYASVAIDDVEATPIVQELRQAARAQSPELKFKSFQSSAGRRDLLRRLWQPGGALDGRCVAYVVDKEYAAVAKIVDLLLEEQAWAEGTDLYHQDEARRLARLLAVQGRRALKPEGFRRLLDAFIAFASRRALGNEAATTAAFYAELETAWAGSTRRNITDIPYRLRGTRPHGDVLHVDAGPLPILEMLVPSIAEVARRWSRRLNGPVSILTDDQKPLTDERLGYLAGALRVTQGATPSSRVKGIALPHLLRGSSEEHPSIQLADLLAGATAAVAERHAGTSSPAADDLLDVTCRSSRTNHCSPTTAPQPSPSPAPPPTEPQQAAGMHVRGRGGQCAGTPVSRGAVTGARCGKEGSSAHPAARRGATGPARPGRSPRPPGGALRAGQESARGMASAGFGAALTCRPTPGGAIALDQK